MTRMSTLSDNTESGAFPSGASFVLRCWLTANGHARGYLLDVRSGVKHPVPDLAELPDLVRSLISMLAESGRDQDEKD